MRTTVDIPEDVLRRAKAEAALRGMKLKDFVTESLRAALTRPDARVAEAALSYRAEPVEETDRETGLPAIRADGEALHDLTPERVQEILEEEEVERALRTKDSG